MACLRAAGAWWLWNRGRPWQLLRGRRWPELVMLRSWAQRDALFARIRELIDARPSASIRKRYLNIMQVARRLA